MVDGLIFTINTTYASSFIFAAHEAHLIPLGLGAVVAHLSEITSGFERLKVLAAS
jgi:hypothetical protein